MKKLLLSLLIPGIVLTGCSSARELDEQKAKQEQQKREDEKIKANTEASQKAKFSQSSAVDYSVSTRQEQVIDIEFQSKKEGSKREVQWQTLAPLEYKGYRAPDNEKNIAYFRFQNLKEGVNYSARITSKEIKELKTIDVKKEENIKNGDEIEIKIKDDGTLDVKLTRKKIEG